MRLKKMFRREESSLFINKMGASLGGGGESPRNRILNFILRARRRGGGWGMRRGAARRGA